MSQHQPSIAGRMVRALPHRWRMFCAAWFIECGGRRLTKHRWRSLRPYPSELEDPAAWGNFIAVDADLSGAVLRAAKRRPLISR